ncbi:MAG: hypothetical protein JRI52_09570, partial [Deltaproteobacteria bacterium]|nr:hypothetical protein [Deltaproteobacteria bacterium]
IAWASMECPIVKATQYGGMRNPDEMALLGRMTTKVNALPKVGEQCFFMGWLIERAGRKIALGGTMHNEKGEVLMMTKLLFITLKEGFSFDSSVKDKD